MSEMSIADRANEAAHEAVLEIIKSSPLSGSGLAALKSGERVAENLISLHKELAAYYRSLSQDD